MSFISATINLLVRRDTLPHVLNTLVGSTVSYTDASQGNVVLGTIAGVQTLTEMAAIAANKSATAYRGLNMASGAAGGLYIVIKINALVSDKKELTTLSNGLDIADLNTFLAGGISIAGALFEKSVLKAAGTVLALTNCAIYLYNLNTNHERITWDKIWYGYEKTSMSGFINDS